MFYVQLCKTIYVYVWMHATFGWTCFGFDQIEVYNHKFRGSTRKRQKLLEYIYIYTLFWSRDQNNILITTWTSRVTRLTFPEYKVELQLKSVQTGLAIYRWQAMDTSIMTQLEFLAKCKRFKSSFENRFSFIQKTWIVFSIAFLNHLSEWGK